MKTVTVRDIYDWINAYAPFELQEDFDNAGFLVGNLNTEVNRVLVALDLNQAVIREAVQNNVQLIITHHPVLFGGTKNLNEESTENRWLCQMIRNNLALIAAHTNLDRCQGGMNDVLAQTIGLQNVAGDGFFRAGSLSAPVTVAEFANQLQEKLSTEVRVMGDKQKLIHKAGLCTGAGSGEWHHALMSGCDAFISGEIKHHEAIAAADAGIVMFECGHEATEKPGIEALGKALQKYADDVKWNLHICLSAESSYSA